MNRPTQPVLVWKWGDNACGKVLSKIVSKENEVLKASPGGGVRSREDRQVRLIT
jgi:hypothetical protein